MDLVILFYYRFHWNYVPHKIVLTLIVENCKLTIQNWKVHDLKHVVLKYGFCNKSFRKDEPLTSWTLLQHICPHFWAWLLNTIAITPKSENKYVVKVFNWSEVHLSEMTCYKIHTLGPMLPTMLVLEDQFGVHFFNICVFLGWA